MPRPDFDLYASSAGDLELTENLTAMSSRFSAVHTVSLVISIVSLPSLPCSLVGNEWLELAKLNPPSSETCI